MNAKGMVWSSLWPNWLERDESGNYLESHCHDQAKDSGSLKSDSGTADEKKWADFKYILEAIVG